MVYTINNYTIAFSGPRILGHLRYDGKIHYDVAAFPSTSARAAFENTVRSMGPQLGEHWEG